MKNLSLSRNGSNIREQINWLIIIYRERNCKMIDVTTLPVEPRTKEELQEILKGLTTEQVNQAYDWLSSLRQTP